MKNLLLCLVILITIPVYSQTNKFTFFSVEGEEFYLIKDGEKQMEKPATQFILTDLETGNHTIKIIFEDQNINSIDYDLRTQNSMGVFATRTFAIVKSKKSNEYYIDPRNTTYQGTTLLDAINNNIEESNKLPCEKNDFGAIKLINTSSNPYNLYVDGKFLTTINGRYEQTINLKSGSHRLKCEQVSGYVLYPTVKEVNVNTTRCSENQFWRFPN
jgi:hypothetical protein